MEYQNLMNLLGDTRNQPSKFRTKYWVEININHEERITSVIKLNLKLQWYGQIYVIIVMHTFTLKEL